MQTPENARIAIAGAGRMGLGIALSFAYSGHRVAVVDMKPRPQREFECLAASFRSDVQDHLQFLVQVAALAPDSLVRVLDRITIAPSSSLQSALSGAEVVFEAVPEVAETKAAVLEAIGAVTASDTLIASTTSTFDADHLAQHVGSPERFLNAHWLNPAHLMPLVEVSPCAKTIASNIARLRELLQTIGKVPYGMERASTTIVARTSLAIESSGWRSSSHCFVIAN